MATGTLHIDLGAIADNWRALQGLARTEAAAVVKADAYGLGAGPVSRKLAEAGCRRFFVAFAEEGLSVRRALGPGPEILVLSGHMEGDARAIAELSMVTLINYEDLL